MKAFITKKEALEQVRECIQALEWLSSQIGPRNAKRLTNRLIMIKDFIEARNGKSDA